MAEALGGVGLPWGPNEAIPLVEHYGPHATTGLIPSELIGRLKASVPSAFITQTLPQQLSDRLLRKTMLSPSGDQDGDQLKVPAFGGVSLSRVDPEFQFILHRLTAPPSELFR